MFEFNGTGSGIIVRTGLLKIRAFMSMAVTLPGHSVWCGVSSRGVVGPFFFEGTVTGAAYFNMLQDIIVPAIRQLFGDEYMNDEYQEDGTFPHYNRDVRTYLDNTFPDRWMDRTQWIC